MPGGGHFPLRSMAFYLPQFHPIPENDHWWGAGFTEWTNVVKARPSFLGHHQPHLPADLGFYDLRVPEVREQQADLAQAYGIDAFCYYHYWFGGRRLLERPFDEVLASGRPELPFLLCWANEPWTRRWDGRSGEVIVPQTYSEADDFAHIRWLCAAFSDPRYVRVDGKPVFLVYKSSLIPDARRTTDRWRAEAQRLGVGELYLVRVEAHEEPKTDPVPLGFDAAVDFQPDVTCLGPRRLNEPVRKVRRALRRNDGMAWHHVHRYDDLVERALARPAPPYKRYPCVTPSWDNSPRRTPALVLTGADPAAFGRWLRATVDRFEPFGPGEDFVFVNAWNEWAEGNHLEPCTRFGRGWLDAHQAALRGRDVPSNPVAATDAALKGER